MTDEHTSIKNIEHQRGRVKVTLHARTLDHAFAAVKRVERDPLLSWPLMWHQVARRRKGGRLRILTLCFYNTGNASSMLAMETDAQWRCALNEVDRIAGTPALV